MNPGVGERRAGLGATRTRGFHHGLLHPGGGSVGLGRGAQRVVRQGGAPRAHSRFPGHALTPTGVMAIRCKQFHLPDL